MRISLKLASLLGMVTLAACAGNGPGKIMADTPALPYIAPDVDELSGIDSEEPDDSVDESPASEEPAPAPAPAAVAPAPAASVAPAPPAKTKTPVAPKPAAKASTAAPAKTMTGAEKPAQNPQR